MSRLVTNSPSHALRRGYDLVHKRQAGTLFLPLVEEQIKRIGILALPLSDYECDRIAMCQSMGYSATTVAMRLSPVFMRARVLGLESVPITKEDFPELYGDKT